MVGDGEEVAVVIVFPDGWISVVDFGSDGSDVVAAAGSTVEAESVSSPSIPPITNRTRSPPSVIAHQRRYQGLLGSAADSDGCAYGSGTLTVILSRRRRYDTGSLERSCLKSRNRSFTTARLARFDLSCIEPDRVNWYRLSGIRT